jgi:hypothetical protein
MQEFCSAAGTAALTSAPVMVFRGGWCSVPLPHRPGLRKSRKNYWRADPCRVKRSGSQDVALASIASPGEMMTKQGREAILQVEFQEVGVFKPAGKPRIKPGGTEHGREKSLRHHLRRA